MNKTPAAPHRDPLSPRYALERAVEALLLEDTYVDNMSGETAAEL